MLAQERKQLDSNLNFLYNAKYQIEQSFNEEVNTRRELEKQLAGATSPEAVQTYEQSLNKELQGDVNAYKRKIQTLEKQIKVKQEEVAQRRELLKKCGEKKYGEKLRERND